MAARRPKNVSAWLGGNRGTVQSGSSTEQQVDTGGGEKDAVNSTLALGLAGAAGLTAAGVALNRSGVGARALNKFNGQSVVVHGSGTGGLSIIEPRLGSAALPYDKAAFAWNPAAYKEKNSLQNLVWDSKTYVTKAPSNQVPAGTLYVAKTPTKNLTKISGATPTPGPLVNLDKIRIFKESGVTTNKPLKVVNQIDVSKFRDSAERAVELAQKIKKAGGKVPKGSTKRSSYIIADDF